MQPTSQMFHSVGEDGYGGIDPVLYDCIVHYKKTGQYPSFIDAHQKTNRNAQFHWRNRCMRYVVAENDMLVYVVQNTGRTRVVVRRGEVKTAIKFIHDRHGHAGQKVTQAAVARRLYWTGIHRDVAKYILECQYCRTRREMRKPPMFGGEIVEPNTENSPFSIDESLVVDRLMLNLPESNALMFEYVDEDLEPYEEVVLEDMDDNLLFDQTDDHFSNDKMGHILAENVEVGAEELIDGNDMVDVKPLPDEHPSAEGPAMTCNIAQKSTRFSKRRSQIEETYVSEVPVKRRVRNGYHSQSTTVGVTTYSGEVLGRYNTLYIPLSQPSSSTHYVEQFNHQQQSQESSTNRVDNQMSQSVDHSLGLGPSMMLATTDPEIVRLQKSVLLLQQEVLTLKKEYLKVKLSCLRRENSSSERKINGGNNGSHDNVDVEL